MKHLIAFSAAIALTAPALTNAQPATPANSVTEPAPAPAPVAVRPGIYAGLNMASIEIDGDQLPIDFDSTYGLVVGASATLDLRPELAFRPELAYAQRGAAFSDGDPDDSFTINFDYIELNALVLGKIPTTANTQPYVFGGPSLGFLINANTVATSNGQSMTEDIPDDETNDLDVSLIAGAGAIIPTGTGAITAELRYQHGMTNIVSGQDAEDVKVSNRVLAVRLGYMF